MTAFGDGVHHAAIRDIAVTLGRPQSEVALLYRELFVVLAARASVTTYLPVLVARKIRERYLNLDSPGNVS